MSFFFFILFLSLFIPTNHPGLPEAYFALFLGVLLFFRLGKPREARAIDGTALILWTIAIISLLLSTFISRSISMSLITLVRYLEGAAVFLLAAMDAATPGRLARTISIFGLLASGVFMIMLVFRAFLPHAYFYNSVTAVNGHHPIAYTIIITLPFILASHRTFMSYCIVCVSLVLSAARGAWIITLLFFSAQTLRFPSPLRNKSTIIGVIFLVLAIGWTTWMSSLPQIEKEKLVESMPMLQFYAKDTNLVMREAFAYQAFTALQRSLLIGHGAGTFSLLSRQYQTQPGYFSQFAHSFPLETLAETGMLGSISIASLMGFILYRAVRAITQKSMYSPFGWALILSAIYSLFEVNLNNLPHWLLFWAIAGVLCKLPRKTPAPPLRTISLGIAVLLIIFSFTSVSAWYFSRYDLPTALRLAPYNKSLALSALHLQTSINAPEGESIQWWHRRDPDILIELSRQNPAYYPLVLQLDPHNSYYLQLFLTHLVDTGNVSMIANLLCQTPNGMTDPSCPMTKSRTFADAVKEKTLLYDALTHLLGDDGHAKFYYALGRALHRNTESPDTTVYLWQKALQTAPQWGFYYLEIAGAQYHWLDDTNAAEQTLESCLRHPLAKQGCTMIRQPADLNPPGTYADDIFLIPAIQ